MKIIMKNRGIFLLAAVLILALAAAGCGGSTAPNTAGSQNQAEETTTTPAAEPVTILVAAAASLEPSFTEDLIPLFQNQYPHITVEGAYDSSGKLQTQIEEGLQADVFMSAATKQMTALKDAGLVDADSIVDLLENRIVLIAPADSATDIAAFADIATADTIALGDPASVPAGQYAQEALTTLGVYDAAAAKASFGSNVTEVLNWVAEGSADVGIVYATDAATTDKVKILAEAPEGSLAQKVIYPVGVVSASAHKDAAQAFVEFLSGDEALRIFEQYGFSPN
jgi:molybdate transport system substrate-binding protein